GFQQVVEVGDGAVRRLAHERNVLGALLEDRVHAERYMPTEQREGSALVARQAIVTFLYRGVAVEAERRIGFSRPPAEPSSFWKVGHEHVAQRRAAGLSDVEKDQ